jgi:hypothetical protein
MWSENRESARAAGANPIANNAVIPMSRASRLMIASSFA